MQIKKIKEKEFVNQLIQMNYEKNYIQKMANSKNVN